MVSFRSFLAAAPLLALAVAQNIAFASTPSVAQAGSQQNISWTGGDGTGATLTLRQGSPQNLKTLNIIADSILQNYYIWTVPTNLASADDYALQITQGQAGINYSGLFSITGGASYSNSSSAAAAASTTAAQNGTMAITTAASATGTGTAMSRNTTFSTASLTSSSSSTSSHSSTSRTSSAATSTSASSSNDAVAQAGSSAALILGIVAAVMLS